MTIKAGATVRLIQPELRGIVIERRINPATDELEALVEFDESGQAVRRWIDTDRIEEVQP
jgi:hypothetical protein